MFRKRFLLSFTRLAAPFNEKLRKQECFCFKLDTDKSEAVETLKGELVPLLLLEVLRRAGQYNAVTDASQNLLFCLLLREQEDKVFRPNSYWSSSLCDVKVRYDTTREQCMAVVWAMVQLLLYVEGTHFSIRTGNDFPQ